MPQVISAISKILLTGHQTNALAIRDFIKAEIKKALTEKTLSPVEFEEQLSELVNERLSPYGQARSMNALFKHEIRYGNEAESDVNTAIEVYIEACVALRLTPEIKKEIEEKILAATEATEDKNLWDIEDLNELPGFYLRNIRQNKMSLNSAIKAYYIYTNKAALILEHYETQFAKLPQKTQIELDEKVSSPLSIEDLSTLNQFFTDEIQNQYVAKFKEEIRQELKSQQTTSVPSIYEDWRYLFYQDDCFPFYSANWIRGSNFIAMSGPRSSASAAIAMHSLLFSDNMKDKPPVTTIIALGNCLAETDVPIYSKADFFNIYYDDRDSTCNNMASGKSLTVVSEEQAGNMPGDFNYQINIKNSYVSPLYTSNAGFISSEVDVSGKKLNALLIGLPDNHSLDLDNDSPETEQLKELFWKISRKPLTETIAVHCAAGVGRTGHVILMLEILKNYQRIFANDNPDTIAKEIQAIVNRMRETRPALIYTLEQYITAIQNADFVYQYALKKKYVTEPATLANMSFLTPAPSPQEEKKEQVEKEHSASLCQLY